ncbi:hypothetical protein A1F94_013913 [Pyrenophora tritici-repentis]|nr:hypothetical protein A1F94_013913 [Pyrenophora tritici-repentis]
MTGDFLWAGNTRVWIKAYGSVTLRVDSADGHRLLYLENVAYCPDLHCSLVSFRILRRQGLWWDTKSDPTILRRSDDSELAVLHEKYGQWILELMTLRREQRFQRSSQRAGQPYENELRL